MRGDPRRRAVRCNPYPEPPKPQDNVEHTRHLKRPENSYFRQLKEHYRRMITDSSVRLDFFRKSKEEVKYLFLAAELTFPYPHPEILNHFAEGGGSEEATLLSLGLGELRVPGFANKKIEVFISGTPDILLAALTVKSYFFSRRIKDFLIHMTKQKVLYQNLPSIILT